MTDILELIDGALYAQNVSDDAMRWTPNTPTPERAAAPLVRVSFRMNGFVVAMARAGRAMAEFAKVIADASDAMNYLDRERARARVRRMHSAYRRRRR